MSCCRVGRGGSQVRWFTGAGAWRWACTLRTKSLHSRTSTSLNGGPWLRKTEARDQWEGPEGPERLQGRQKRWLSVLQRLEDQVVEETSGRGAPRAGSSQNVVTKAPHGIFASTVGPSPLLWKHGFFRVPTG